MKLIFCRFVSNHLTIFVANRWRMAAAWERVALAVGCSSLWLLAEQIHVDPRYLANIELEQTIPSLPVIIQLVKICGLPMERYFNPEVMREESKLRQRVSHKLALCPEKYLPIVEATIDGAIKMNE